MVTYCPYEATISSRCFWLGDEEFAPEVTKLSYLSMYMCVTLPSPYAAGVYGGEYCWDYDHDLRWCTYGCCGYLDRDCCDAKYVLINCLQPWELQSQIVKLS